MSDNKDERKQVKKLIYGYLQIDDSNRRIKEKIKELNKEKKELDNLLKEKEAVILEYLENMGQNKIILPDNEVLEKAITKQKAPLKKDYMVKSLNLILDNHSESERLVDQILNNRPIVEKPVLRRKKLKETKTKK